MPQAKNLKYCRKKEGLTQSELAEKLGVSKATIISWESRKHAIPEPSARRISELFGVDYIDFCDEDFERSAQAAKRGSIVLTEGEEKAVLMYRKLPPDVKALVTNAIEVAYENTRRK